MRNQERKIGDSSSINRRKTALTPQKEKSREEPHGFFDFFIILFA
jgi:hypothetical protein